MSTTPRAAHLDRDGRRRAAGVDRTRYNAAGQVTGADWQGLPGTSQTFGYDAFGRFTDVSWAEYAYDPAGNPTELGGTVCLTYNDGDELLQASTPDGLLEFGHDGVGNRTAATPASGPATTYAYDQGGRLTAVDRVGRSLDRLPVRRHGATDLQDQGWDHDAVHVGRQRRAAPSQ